MDPVLGERLLLRAGEVEEVDEVVAAPGGDLGDRVDVEAELALWAEGSGSGAPRSRGGSGQEHHARLGARQHVEHLVELLDERLDAARSRVGFAQPVGDEEDGG